MARFVQDWQGLVEMGQPWSRRRTALCTAGTLWSDQRAHHIGYGSWGRLPGQSPSLSHTTPAALLHIPAGRKQPRLAPSEDDGALLLHPRHSDFCPHSLAWAITAPSRFILITGGNTTWARILMPWLASLGAHLSWWVPHCPNPAKEYFESNAPLHWSDGTFKIPAELSHRVACNLIIPVTCFYLQVAQMEGRKNRSHHYCALIYANVFKTWDYPLSRDTCSI